MDQVQTLLLMQQVMASTTTKTETTKSVESDSGSDFRKMMDKQTEEARPAETDEQPVQKEDPQETEAPKQEDEVDEEALQQMAATQMAYVDTAKLVVVQETAPVAARNPVANTAPAVTGNVAQNVPAEQMAGKQTAQAQTAQPQQAQTGNAAVQTAETPQQPQAQTQNQGENPAQQQKADVSAKPQADGMKTTVTTDQEAPAEAPVFKQVESTPIKVSDTAATPKAPESQDVQSQISDKLTKALAGGESKVQIQLTPENLGKVTIEITHQKDGSLRIVLQAESSSTRMLLEKDMASLQNILTRTVQQEVQVEVPRNQESQRQDLTDDQQRDQQRQQQEEKQDRQASEDFMNQLRLGLVSTDETE